MRSPGWKAAAAVVAVGPRSSSRSTETAEPSSYGSIVDRDRGFGSPISILAGESLKSAKFTITAFSEGTAAMGKVAANAQAATKILEACDCQLAAQQRKDRWKRLCRKLFTRSILSAVHATLKDTAARQF